MQQTHEQAQSTNVLQQPQEINLADVIRLLWRNRHLLVISAISFLIVGVLYALLATPIYRASAVVAPYQEQGSQGGLSQLVSQFGGMASMAGISINSSYQTTDAYLAQMKSRKFTEKFLTDNGIVQVLFAADWDNEENQWFDKPSAEQMYQVFSEYVSVGANKKTGLISLTITYKDPKLAAEWANLLLKDFNRHIRESTINDAERSIQFLKQQIKKTSVVGMQEILYSLIEKQLQIINLAQVRDEYAFKVIDPAVAPERRAKPKRGMAVLMSLVFGLFFGVFVIVFHEFLQKNFPRYQLMLRNLKRSEAPA